MSKEITRIRLLEPTVVRGQIRQRGALLDIESDIDKSDARYLLGIGKAQVVGSDEIKLAKSRVSDAKRALKTAEDQLKAAQNATEGDPENREKLIQETKLSMETAQAAVTREEAELARLSEK